MKRYVLALMALAIGLSAFAQKEDDKYIGFAILGSGGKNYQTISTSSGSSRSLSNSTSQISNTVLAGQFEVGYFTSDYLRVSLGLGVPFSSAPDGYGDYMNSLGFQVSPSISRYFRICDGVYYTPEIAGAFEWGNYYDSDAIISLDAFKTDTAKQPYKGWVLSVYFLAFEFRLGENTALGVALGNVSYTEVSMTRDVSSFSTDTKTTIKDGVLNCSLNSATASLRFYL